MKLTIIRTNVVNITQKSIIASEIHIQNGKIVQIVPTDLPCQNYALAGFVDAHVHIESSMLVPSEFAKWAVRHGTVATVSDPHEIANVLGVSGVEFMIENGKKVPFKFYFGVPSCVPATNFETAGASISAADIEYLFQKYDLHYLSEMMNYPAVIFDDPEVLEKIRIAQKYGKVVDGHAPALSGEALQKYAAAGISTDHECFSKAEALEKLALGIKILIREGSAAKNFEALIELLPQFSDNLMFCSDDKHPDDLMEGHINQLVKRALAKGFDIFDILKVACINPVKHYKLDVGLLQEGDPADFIIVDNLENLNVLQTYINGVLLAENGQSFIQSVDCQEPNNFNTDFKKTQDFEILAKTEKIQVIECLNGELMTNSVVLPTKIVNGKAVADPENDILKITVVNRYQNVEPAVAFIKNFGLKNGAIASSVGHDSHNIIAVGTSDELICEAVNLLIATKGGISAVDSSQKMCLPLPIAGIMTAQSGQEVAKKYKELDAFAKKMGSTLFAPFMSLSFMALLVIPNLKLSDKGLFDGKNFAFVDIFV